MSANTALTVNVPANAADVAALQKQTESDAETIAHVKVVDADDYAFADELLSDIVRRKDAAITMRKTATVPLYTVIRTIEGWFRPLVDACERAEKHLKGELGAYRLAQAEREREARELAAQAATEGDGATMIEALTVATEAASKPEGARATTRFAWRVKGVPYPLAVPREYWTIDRAKLDALAKAHKGDDAPVVAGVEFERVALVGAKR